MERKTKKIKIEYVNKDGSEGVLSVDVKFTSMGILRDYDEIKSEQARFKSIIDQMGDLQSEWAAVAANELEKQGKLEKEIDVKKLQSKGKTPEEIMVLQDERISRVLKQINKTDFSKNKEMNDIINKINEFEKQAVEFVETDFFRKRYELIEKILLRNGVKDERFLSFDFWENDVNYTDLVMFLEEATSKDFTEDKKKAVMI